MVLICLVAVAIVRTVIADFVRQSLLRDGKDCRLKALTYQLSADLKSCKVRARRPIADHILNGRAFPKRFFCGRHGVARHMLSKSFGPRCPEIGAKTQSRSTRGPPGVSQGAQTCQLDEWACLFGGNADSAQRQRNGIRTLCPFLSEGYKRGIQWPKKVNKNRRFSLVNAGIPQLVEQLICNRESHFCRL